MARLAASMPSNGSVAGSARDGTVNSSFSRFDHLLLLLMYQAGRVRPLIMAEVGGTLANALPVAAVVAGYGLDQR